MAEEVDLAEVIEAARARINHSHTAGRCWLVDEDLAVIARDAVRAAAPLIEGAVRERLGREIRDFAKDAARTDDPSAILGLICAAAMVEGKAKGSIDELADELDDLIGDATAEKHPERICGFCGRANVSAWSAPSPLWNAVMRGGDINAADRFGGVVCPNCFAFLAEEAGIAHRWRLYAERVHVELATVTPSGRVWNELTWLWEEPAAEGSGS